MAKDTELGTVTYLASWLKKLVTNYYSVVDLASKSLEKEWVTWEEKSNKDVDLFTEEVNLNLLKAQFEEILAELETEVSKSNLATRKFLWFRSNKKETKEKKSNRPTTNPRLLEEIAERLKQLNAETPVTLEFIVSFRDGEDVTPIPYRTQKLVVGCINVVYNYPTTCADSLFLSLVHDNKRPLPLQARDKFVGTLETLLKFKRLLNLPMIKSVSVPTKLAEELTEAIEIAKTIRGVVLDD